MPSTAAGLAYHPRVLMVDDALARPETAIGRAAEAIAAGLAGRNCDVVRALSFEDGEAIVGFDASLRAVLVNWHLGTAGKTAHEEAPALLKKLRERHPDVPVFLTADRKLVKGHMTIEIAEMVDEFVWLLEDTADFVAGRVMAAIERYRAQLLPPYARALAKYAELHEQSWSAPGHQGGIAFTKLPAGRAFFDFMGENVFRIDMGIERGALGSLLDHTGVVAESEKYAARVFGAHRSYSGVVGTSGSNRSIMQACMKAGDLVVLDRNCHKSIEQGLMLTGAQPVYMVPTRNRYGIIGPIAPSEMDPKTIQAKAKSKKKPVYAVVTNSTYDGLCYRSDRVEELLGKSSDRVHMDEAWYGYARFNPMYENHFAMRGDPAKHKGPTVFATHSTHKLLAALSQASYIHVRDGKGAIDHHRFNQAYMMHTSTSPLYAIVASNDITSAMMDGNGGRSLTQEVIAEAVDFRQAVGRVRREFEKKKDWFFTPWNVERVGKVPFEDVSSEILSTKQEPWILRPGDKWHGFDDIADDWCMLDPIKVSILSPGMGEDGKLEKSGVPAALINAWFNRFGIVPTRVTDFQVMFLFSIGVTRGKWGTLLTNLLAFKRAYDQNRPVAEALPEIAAAHPARYAKIGMHDLGDELFEYLREKRPGDVLNAAYETLPEPDMTPREGYERLVAGEVELVSSDKLAGRTAANAVMPYPPGIPMLMTGENFGAKSSPQIEYLKSMEQREKEFPGFSGVIEGAEMEDGVYHVLCLKK
ncbi:MAG TPA: Orn/Lys/Arg decarboxylase N-terminal domain-containing protein [Burkholderiales bacterium]|nr:Orn/Lys/Arg decarboxylase N-terminal domain-containing protein [Burkholderiales bacterium]